MARTLVISNADFSVNKLDTVTFGDKACTSITLDKSTDSITSIGATSTLVATVTPADTTDEIIWSTDNSDVISVAGGVVTAVGCGTATITATCGNYSATCDFSVTHICEFDYALNRYLSKADNRTYLTGGTLSNYAIGFSSTGDTRRISYDDRSESRYPIIIPKGATTIVITCTNFKPYGYYLDSTVSSGLSSIAEAMPKDGFGSALTTFGSRTVTIPTKTGDYANMDSVAFVFSYNGTISDEAMEEITITFTA